MPKQQTVINERKTALDILLCVKQKNEPIARCTDRAFHARDITDKRSRAFITQLVYGTVENMIRLDHIIDTFAKVKVKKMKPKIAAILELSVYQIIFMDSVPVSAACDEGVKLAKKEGLAGLSGFVNAVLRSVVAGSEKVPFPDAKEDLTVYLSLEYSVPEWCIKMWQSDFGDEKAWEIAKGVRKKRPLFIRVNTDLVSAKELTERLEKEGVKVEKRPDLPPYVLTISGLDSIAALDSFKKGMFYVQDLSCILSGEMYGLKKGDNVLDLCAAPGGKSINAALLLSEMGGGSVTSCDVSDEKTALINENIQRMKLQNIKVLRSDATVFNNEFEGAFDVVIADVPCSGLGIISRKPDILLRLKEEDTDKLSDLQKKIIDNGIRYVKKGGRFIFSTCTLNKKENENNAEYIKNNHNLEELCMKTEFPGRQEVGDGFFTAVFRK